MSFTQDALLVLLIGLFANATNTDLATNTGFLFLLLLILLGNNNNNQCCNNNSGSLNSLFPGQF